MREAVEAFRRARRLPASAKFLFGGHGDGCEQGNAAGAAAT